MNLDVDFLIDFFKKYTGGRRGEIGEAETEPAPAAAPAPSTSAPSSSSSGGGSTGSGKSTKKWETGLARSHSNQIGNTVWSSGRNFGKTYMNDPKYKWTSGRTMGKTGGSDFA